jgi:hypothetical protein
VTFWVEENTRDLCQQVMHFGPDLQILFRRITPEQQPLLQQTA